MRRVGEELVFHPVGFSQLFIQLGIFLGVAKVLFKPISGKADKGGHHIDGIKNAVYFPVIMKHSPNDTGHDANGGKQQEDGVVLISGHHFADSQTKQTNGKR